MLKKIRVHNYVTGHLFTLVEYLAVVGVLSPFLIYYLTHGRPLYSVVAIGVILNCLTMSALALASMVKGDPSIGFMKLRREPELRRSISEQYPDLGRLSLFLSVLVLVPFSIFAGAILDGLFGRRD